MISKRLIVFPVVLLISIALFGQTKEPVIKTDAGSVSGLTNKEGDIFIFNFRFIF